MALLVQFWLLYLKVIWVILTCSVPLNIKVLILEIIASIPVVCESNFSTVVKSWILVEVVVWCLSSSTVVVLVIVIDDDVMVEDVGLVFGVVFMTVSGLVLGTGAVGVLAIHIKRGILDA